MGTWISLAKPHSERFYAIEKEIEAAPEDSTIKKKRKKTQPNYTPQDRMGDPYAEPDNRSPFELKDPDVIKKEVELDTSLDHYNVNEKVGDQDYRTPSEVSFEEYYKMKNQEMLKNYWKNKSTGPLGDKPNKATGPLSLKIPIRGLEGPFGSNFVDIRPSGLVTLDFGGKWQRVYNPALTVRQQKNGVFDFDQQITMNVVGKIGEKLQLTANWDTKAAFEFQNNVKVQYTAFEEDIIQGVEVGRISMPLNSSLINGAQNLFGIKTKLKFGRMTVTSVLARQDGKVDEMVIKGGSQGRTFEVKGSAYEDYKHFFLSQFFRDNYERSFKTMPVLSSGAKITRVEVYITNRNSTTTNLRDMVAYQDLGEGNKIYNTGKVTPNPLNLPGNPPAANEANDLFNYLHGLSRNSDAISTTLTGAGYVNGDDYTIIKSARKLDLNKDYTINYDLGFISLQTTLQTSEVLAVAFEYSYNGKTYKVGELQEDYGTAGPRDALILKMLKPATIKLNLPSWNLMMKNVYNLGATQLTRDNFQLRVIYKDDLTGLDVPYLQDTDPDINIRNKPLLQLYNLDNLNPNNDPSPDGNFDYIEGVTVDSKNGRIFFPMLEPFGKTLTDSLVGQPQYQQKYVFAELYNSTKQFAEQQASHNKFFLKGRYQASSSSEIVLPGINIAPGSVKVLVGGNTLTEGKDFTIDYTLGRLKIINDGALASGQEIRIRFEKQDLFNFRRKSFYGARFDYQINKDFIIGGTILQQNEAPQISRVNIGDEPSKNTVWGLDVNYNSASRRLTKLVDMIPFIDTKAPSQVTFQGEFAQMLPGHNKKINQGGANGVAFIDDFEGSKTPYDLKSTPTKWKLAATPRRFAESTSATKEFSKNRAKLAWYNIDNVFYRPNNGIGYKDNPDDIINHFERAVYPYELYTNQDKQQVAIPLTMLDLAYYPMERGPYNYHWDINNDEDGSLKNPTGKWAGISRNITNDIDFDNANIQYIEFWMMSPFDLDSTHSTIGGVSFDKNNRGKLYFNLGEISEDVIKDTRHGFENGITGQAGEDTTTRWGKVATKTFITDAFNNDPALRPIQDIGLDGLNSAQERAYRDSSYVKNFLDSIPALAKPKALLDPSADDFIFYQQVNGGDEVGIPGRYKNNNGYENNSPINSGTGITPSNTSSPDNEDLNQDQTINDLEAYFEYQVDIDPNRFVVGQNFVVGSQKIDPKKLGASVEKWYQFRIPIRNPTSTVGNITDFKSIRFMRMYMTGFSTPVILRMAQLQLVANQWRGYQSTDIDETGLGDLEPDDALINISTVNVEENSAVDPDGKSSPYVIPPGFSRDQDITSTVNRRLNEQSLRLCVDNLNERSVRAAYKNVSYDFLNYGRVNMFIHAETQSTTNIDGAVSAFLRFGTDFKDNYYEIEVPLYFTTPLTSSDPYTVWRDENQINVAIQDLINAKLERDRVQGHTGAALLVPYSTKAGNKTIWVKGKPDMSAVVTVMIGVKNPKGGDLTAHSFCIWADELRVTDFNEKSGWAAVGKLNLKLADFGNVTASARFIGAGFGSLEQKVSQRQRNNTLEWGVNGNFNMDKFLPKKLGIKLPMYVGINRTVITPRYDPLNPDVLLKQQLDNLVDQSSKNEYKKLVVDQTTTKAINFTNIQKVKTNPDSKKHIYDVENLKLTLGYTETKRTSYDIKEYVFKYYKGALGYDYTGSPKSYEPLKNVKLFDKKYLKLLKDFNFTPMPNMFTFRTDLDRKITTTQYYQSGPLTDGQTPLYEKSFTMSRVYGSSWAMTKNLTANYRADAYSVVDEPIGAPGGKSYNTEVRKNAFKLGRLKTFNQKVDLIYKLPLDKIPFLDWINSDYRYEAGYTWTAGPLNLTDTLGNSYGNIIQNTRSQTVNGKIDLNKLYNKNKFLKEVNNPVPRRKNVKPDPKDTVQVKRENRALKSALRTLMLIKSVNATYTNTQGTQLTGYLPKPSLFGVDQFDNAGNQLPFILGSQNAEFRHTAADKGWISRSRSLNAPFIQRKEQSLSFRTAIEPNKDLRIQLDASLKKGTNYQELFRIDSTVGTKYVSDNPVRNGTHSVSTVTIATSFGDKETGSGDPNGSKAFNKFVANRYTIAERLGGRSLNSQDVLIPSFLAAYKGSDAGSINTSPMPNIPLPNWRIDFTGLMKIAALKKRFEAITLTHAYTSVYNVGGYTSSLLYGSDYVKPGNNFLNTPPANIQNASNEDIPVYIISDVNIREAFSPLLGINIRTKGKWNYRIEYRRARNLSLSLSNAQVREENNQDFVFGVGFVKAGVKIPKFLTKGQTKTLKNELNVRLDLTIRDTKGVQRQIDQTSTVTTGSLNWQIKPTITYNLSTRVSLQFYFERTYTNPKVSSSFKRTTTSAGIQLRFTLS
ncbi:MAG: cell surface protein SprA [Cytophagaceae bacterium]|nr:cell surface protein SprA [Cytophagaceae bacterium]